MGFTKIVAVRDHFGEILKNSSINKQFPFDKKCKTKMGDNENKYKCKEISIFSDDNKNRMRYQIITLDIM
jgi:hypothetical protein